jgi:prepilin-type N-terminal cleavage/methylation domain-containing protein/prepilin-type processing-associated H-X9-DG protein
MRAGMTGHRVRKSAEPAGMIPRPRVERGFTLIEVLVVVAIIALLVSILIPAFVSARDNARLIVCQSNQRQIAFAWHNYFRDNRDRPPRDDLAFARFGGKQGRALNYGGPEDPIDNKRFLNKYLSLPLVVGAYPHNVPSSELAEVKTPRIADAVRVFQCPGDTGPFIQTDSNIAVPTNYFDYYGTSYRASRYVVGPKPPTPTRSNPCFALVNKIEERFRNMTIGLSTIHNESRLVLMGDYGFDDWQNSDVARAPQQFHARSKRNTVSLSTGVGWAYYNIAFVDGHVALTGIGKGIYVCGAYTIVPFRDLQQAFAEAQLPGIH